MHFIRFSSLEPEAHSLHSAAPTPYEILPKEQREQLIEFSALEK